MTLPSIQFDTKFRVLLAITNAEFTSSVGAMLRGFGVGTIRKAHTSAEALTLLETQPFDAMVLDLALIPQNGIAVTRRLRAADEWANRSIPIVMLSGVTDRSVIESARDAGISEFVRLPASAEIIGLRLKTALTAPRAFVTAPDYTGPDRRRRAKPAPDIDRRGSKGPTPKA